MIKTMTVTEFTVVHVRRDVKSGSRRPVTSQTLPGHTLCGAPITSADFTERDAQRLNEETADTFHVCQFCLERL